MVALNNLYAKTGNINVTGYYQSAGNRVHMSILVNALVDQLSITTQPILKELTVLEGAIQVLRFLFCNLFDIMLLGDVKADVKARIDKAMVAFLYLKEIWKSKDLCLKNKIRIINTTVNVTFLRSGYMEDYSDHHKEDTDH